MKLHELHAIPGANKAVTRKGRGIGSGNGKTAGFGSKGQKARSGVKHAGFEGGQMPLARRLPKVGFNNIFATQYAIVNVADLEAAFEAGEVVDTEALKAKGLVKKTLDGVKVLGNGELTKALTVKAAAYSASAKEKIEKAPVHAGDPRGVSFGLCYPGAFRDQLCADADVLERQHAHIS